MFIFCRQIKLKEVLREHFARHEAGGKSTRAIVFTQFRDSVEVGFVLFRFGCEAGSFITICQPWGVQRVFLHTWYDGPVLSMS